MFQEVEIKFSKMNVCTASTRRYVLQICRCGPKKKMHVGFIEVCFNSKTLLGSV